VVLRVSMEATDDQAQDALAATLLASDALHAIEGAEVLSVGAGMPGADGVWEVSADVRVSVEGSNSLTQLRVAQQLQRANSPHAQLYGWTDPTMVLP
jgi:hypothetical protein